MFLEPYRRPKYHARLALVILTLNMLAMLGCQPTNTAQQRPVEPPVSDPILQPQGYGTVQVEIDAQCDLGLSLFQIRGNESCRMQDLSAGNRTNGQSLQTVELESGLFVVRAKESKFAVPVPAIAMAHWRTVSGCPRSWGMKCGCRMNSSGRRPRVVLSLSFTRTEISINSRLPIKRVVN